MVRALTPRPKAGSRVLVLPGTSGAEPWEAWTDGIVNRSGTAADIVDRTGDSTLALPTIHVTSLPLWLNETDEKKFNELIELQLEIRGLQTRGVPAVFDWTTVEKEANRTLVLVGVLSALLPPELEASGCSSFDVSARYFQLPERSLVVWSEQDHLALAISRHGALCYFQAITGSAINIRALQDLTCVLASLQMQGIVDNLRTIVFWTDELPSGAADLGATLHLQVTHEERPAPVPPLKPWTLTPARMRLAKQQRSKHRRWMLGLSLVLLLLGGVMLALGARFFMTMHEVSRLRQWQMTHASALESIRDTEAKWKALAPVVDARSYPLEVLFQVSTSLPREQAHLTLFEANGNHILIKAEAKNLKAGIQFFDAVKKNRALNGYTWEMSQPHSLANDLTQLQIQGTKAP